METLRRNSSRIWHGTLSRQAWLVEKEGGEELHWQPLARQEDEVPEVSQCLI